MDYFLSLPLIYIALLLFAAMIAGYVDTLVGGGGLITIPALLAAGLPPVAALGTNKLQACAGSGTASASLILAKNVSLKSVRWPMLTAFLGALLGAIAVQYADKRVLEIAIPVVISLILIYFLKAPKPSLAIKTPKLSSRAFRSSVVPAIGFYDGALGPATGSFFVLAGVSLRAQGIVEATMRAKTLNFATNIAALMVFISYGQVAIAVGLLMMVGQFIGARFGANALSTINPDSLRWLVVVMCALMLIFWLLQNVA